MKNISALIILLFLKFYLYAQRDSIKFTKDFSFKDGIYVSIDDLKNNNPCLTEENFALYNKRLKYLDNNFFEKSDFNPYVRQNVYYSDDNDQIKRIAIDSLFGFVIDGYPFAIMPQKRNAGFKVLRIFRLGIISYCFESNATASRKIVKPGVIQKENTPLLPNDNIRPLWLTSDTNYPIIDRKRVSQFLLDFKNGEIYKYNRKNFMKILESTNQVLFDEYSKLSLSKRNKLIFNYLTKVNELNPIYIYH